MMKHKEERQIIYYMTPHVGTYLPQEIREKAQKLSQKLQLIDGRLI